LAVGEAQGDHPNSIAQGEDHGMGDTADIADGDKPGLAIVEPIILDHESAFPIKVRGNGKVDAMLDHVGEALRFIPDHHWNNVVRKLWKVNGYSYYKNMPEIRRFNLLLAPLFMGQDGGKVPRVEPGMAGGAGDGVIASGWRQAAALNAPGKLIRV
jgi:hypothetical protein